MSHRTLRSGSTGEDVVELQAFMNDWLELRPGIAEDGSFGPITKDTAIRLQTEFNKTIATKAIGKLLVVDGIIGTNSWAVIDWALTKDPDKEKKKPKNPPVPKKLLRKSGGPVPHYYQGDPKWGSRLMGSRTISAEGCAMCSVAMVLAYYGHDIDPISLDTYLDANDGYSGGRNLRWQTAFDAGNTPGKKKLLLKDHQFKNKSVFHNKIVSRVTNNLPTLINVGYGSNTTSGEHWVVAVGYTKTDIIINDPGTASGNGAKNPHQETTLLYASKRRGGLNPVRLCLFG